MIINKWEEKALFHNGLSRKPVEFVIFNKIIEMQFTFHGHRVPESYDVWINSITQQEEKTNWLIKVFLLQMKIENNN